MRTLILGTNLRGLPEVARMSLDEGSEVLVYDAEVAEPPADLVGRVTVLPTRWDSRHLHGVDRVVTSPWFPEVAPPISDVLAADIPIVTEAGFALERLDTPFVAVTGTNGKTTVTEAVADMLRASGVRAISAGNVGGAVSEINDNEADLLVLELSSYQLRFLGHAAPIAAALLNISPDHLDWHGSFAAYRAAKARVFRGMDHAAVLAYNVHDDVVVAAVEDASCALVPCSGVDIPANGNGVVNGCIVISEHEIPTTVSDPSFLFDLVAAGTVALAAGATISGIAAAIDSFVPGAHRRQHIPTSDGISWIDDSKATNPHACGAAVAANAPVILLVGGQNKGLDLSPMARLDGVSDLIAFGEAGPEIASTAARPITVVMTLEDAVEAARAVAERGDTVLLSPGCASFDAFPSYADRGDAFQRLVRRQEGAAS